LPKAACIAATARSLQCRTATSTSANNYGFTPALTSPDAHLSGGISGGMDCAPALSMRYPAHPGGWPPNLTHETGRYPTEEEVGKLSPSDPSAYVLWSLLPENVSKGASRCLSGLGLAIHSATGYLRHPYVCAQATSCIAEVTSGRMILGLGACRGRAAASVANLQHIGDALWRNPSAVPPSASPAWCGASTTFAGFRARRGGRRPNLLRHGASGSVPTPA
jgi:hypothetical protein